MTTITRGACLFVAWLLVYGCGNGDSPTAPSFTRSGTGNTVFDKPASVTRVRITGQFAGATTNFIVWCGQSLLVNELLGTSWGRTTYDGTHSAPHCAEVRIEMSTGVVWTFTAV